MNVHPPEEAARELSPREGYAAWASCYDDDGNPLIALEGPVVRSMFGPVAGMAALDVGCGTGRHTRSLAEAGAKVVALDPSVEMLAQARRKLAGTEVAWVRHALPDPFPFPDQCFELAVMGLVAEHIADLAAAMRDLARVVRPGGRFVLSALHPARTAEGQRARFIDPETGLRQPIATIHRSVEEYLGHGEAAGWHLIEEQSLLVGDDLAGSHPRAARYVGMPLGWVAAWRNKS